jgi:hypothetical protein
MPVQVEMDDTERALLAEANAANGGAPLPPPPAPPPGAAAREAGDAEGDMDIEVAPEPANIRIVRDYKRADPRCANFRGTGSGYPCMAAKLPRRPHTLLECLTLACRCMPMIEVSAEQRCCISHDVLSRVRSWSITREYEAEGQCCRVLEDDMGFLLNVSRGCVAGLRRARAAEAGKFVVSPITGELVAVAEMAEHMRVSLIDPKWKEQRDTMLAKIRRVVTPRLHCLNAPNMQTL